MTDEEFESRLRLIAKTANEQKVGPYTTQSDAYAALELVEAMALLLVENAGAARRPPPDFELGETR